MSEAPAKSCVCCGTALLLQRWWAGTPGVGDLCETCHDAWESAVCPECNGPKSPRSLSCGACEPTIPGGTERELAGRRS